MRICHVVRQYKPGVGGLENFVATLARSLNELGADNEILTLDRLFHDAARRLPASETIDGLCVRRVPMVGHRRFFWPHISAKMLAPYDVIHVHGVDGMFDRVARQPRRHGQILVGTSHGLFFHTPWMNPVKELYLNTGTRLAAARFQVLIANSKSDMAKLRTVREDVIHLPNGVSPLGHFCASGEDLLYLGRLARHKHVDRLIAALAQPELDDVTLHIVGPEWDVTHLQLAQLAERLGVADRVKLHGSVSKDRLASIAKSCAVFVSASTYEGFGMSLIEAMSVGLAPVVELNASFEELLTAAPCGELTTFTRPADAAKAIRRQRADIDVDRRRAAITYAQRFSWQGHAGRVLAIYREALAREQLASPRQRT